MLNLLAKFKCLCILTEGQKLQPLNSPVSDKMLTCHNVYKSIFQRRSQQFILITCLLGWLTACAPQESPCPCSLTPAGLTLTSCTPLCWTAWMSRVLSPTSRRAGPRTSSPWRGPAFLQLQVVMAVPDVPDVSAVSAVPAVPSAVPTCL